MTSFIEFFVALVVILSMTRRAPATNLSFPSCKTCKWYSPGKYPKCNFYKQTYEVLGSRLEIVEFAEHVRSNPNMCGEEGYMHEPEEESSGVNVFTAALKWSFNIPPTLISCVIRFLVDEEANMLRGF